MKAEKPLGQKSYGSIPHLPGSRRGPGDHGITDDQAKICLSKTRDNFDKVVVQEKLDGSCVAVAKIDGFLIPLIRAGYPALSSPHKQHHLFHHWVAKNESAFHEILEDGERACGEWLAQAHGTRYSLPHEPFVLFDIMRGHDRLCYDHVQALAIDAGFTMPLAISIGPAISIADVMSRLEPSGHGAIDPVEGAVWRVERAGKVDFLAKYVRTEKVDGCYLPEKTGGEPIWNYIP